MKSTPERLQKILARAGVASRRAAEQLITNGHVRVNGTVVTELGARADLSKDRIDVDGRPIAREQHVYYLIHKPRGMVTTLRDPEDRPSLSELLHRIPERVYPVGRLDFHTSGALILTNDGDLAQALLHPSKAVPKTYVVKLSREVDDYMLNALSMGIKLDDGYVTQPARVEHLRDEDGKSWLQITITEGKNRQIHRMIEALDTRVMRLSRLSFAGISTEGLRPGNIRPLEPEEVAMLRREYATGAPVREEAPREPERTTQRASVRAAIRDYAREPSDRAPDATLRPRREPAREPTRERGRESPRDRRESTRERGRESPREGARESRDRRESPRERGRESPREGARESRDRREPTREGARESRDRREPTREGARESRDRREPTREGARDSLRARNAQREPRSDARERSETPRNRKSDARDPRAPKRAEAARPQRAAADSRNARTHDEKKATRVDSPNKARHKSRPT